MIECPDCHAVLRPNAKRCACGWMEHSLRKTAEGNSGTSDSLRRCPTCNVEGWLSVSPTGQRWCRDHFPGFKKADKLTPPPGGFQALKAILKRPDVDPETAAERAAIQWEGAGR